jgi:hypothetical protein
LNHPNIATVYGLETAEGIRALVMEPRFEVGLPAGVMLARVTTAHAVLVVLRGGQLLRLVRSDCGRHE